MKNIILNSKNREQSVYFWNMCSSMLNAFQTVFILMIISRIDPIVDAGIFTIAFAIGNLMLTIGNYGIRQFQVSDINRKYCFRDYLTTRLVTCTLLAVVSLIYVGYYYSVGLYNEKKSIVILLICAAKMIDALEDVFLGMFQQEERLDISGKILSFRLLSYIGTYILTYCISQNLILASFFSLIVSVVLFFTLNVYVYKKFPEKREDFGLKEKRHKVLVRKLLCECFPLFVSAYLVMYVANAPKYAIDKILSSQEQACFTYIFMPVFVIGLLSQFVYQPIIGKLSLLWYEAQIKEFKKMIRIQLLVILLLALFALGGGALLGIPVLSMIYGVNLSGYRIHLIVLLIGGTFLAYTYFFQMVLTIMRKQKYLVWGYVIAYIVFIFQGGVVVKKYGLLGISVFYMLVMAGIALVFAVVSEVIAKRKGNG